MKILWISWKDWQHPEAGGAEVVLHELAKRQVAEGHEVTILTALYAGSSKHDEIDGVKIIRLKGNRYVQPFITLPYYIRHMRNKFDLVIEAVNTAPYFSPFFRGKAKSVLFYHQLARKIWFFEAPLPIALVGYALLEPIATFLLGKSKAQVITVSESTKRDLTRFGFNPKRIHIISEGIELKPVDNIEKIKKFNNPTMLSHGAMREMKRTLDQIKAFEIAKKQIPNLQLKVSGSSGSKYGQEVLKYISASPYAKDIEYLGRTTDAQKIRLMQKCHIITVTSVKEGWGLIVTEANSQGTPAVVYDVDGLRDSVKNGKTGVVTQATSDALGTAVIRLIQDKPTYNKMRLAAWQWSRVLTFGHSYDDFNKAIRNRT